MSRVYNFSAGPAVLPLEVLQEAQQNLVDYKGSGMSVMEMSHRGKEYDAIHQEAIATFKELCGLDDDWSAAIADERKRKALRGQEARDNPHVEHRLEEYEERHPKGHEPAKPIPSPR